MRGIEEARDQLSKETNIVEIVKSRRLIFKALHQLLTNQELTKLKDQSNYLIIDPDLKSDENEIQIDLNGQELEE